MCLDNNSRSAVYAQFSQQDPLEDFPFEEVIDVLTKFHGAKETQSNQLERLEKLSLHNVTMHGFQQYRDRYTELSAHVSDGQLTATGRCRLVLRNLPKSLRPALAMIHNGEFTDVAELFERARIGIRALQEQTDAIRSSCKGAPRQRLPTASACLCCCSCRTA